MVLTHFKDLGFENMGKELVSQGGVVFTCPGCPTSCPKGWMQSTSSPHLSLWLRRPPNLRQQRFSRRQQALKRATRRICGNQQMGVSKNSGFSPQIIHSNRVFHYFHHPFWGTPIFGNIQIVPSCEGINHGEGFVSLSGSLFGECNTNIDIFFLNRCKGTVVFGFDEVFNSMDLRICVVLLVWEYGVSLNLLWGDSHMHYDPSLVKGWNMLVIFPSSWNTRKTNSS